MPSRPLKRSTAIAWLILATGLICISVDYMSYQGQSKYGDTLMYGVIRSMSLGSVRQSPRDGGWEQTFQYYIDTTSHPPLVVGFREYHDPTSDWQDHTREESNNLREAMLGVRYTYGGLWHVEWWGRQYALYQVDADTPAGDAIIARVISDIRQDDDFSQDSSDYANGRLLSDLENGIWEWRKPLPMGYVFTAINIAMTIAALASTAFLLTRCVRPRAS